MSRVTSVRRLQVMSGRQRATSRTRHVRFLVDWLVFLAAMFAATGRLSFGNVLETPDQMDPAAVARGPWRDIVLTTGERWQAECLRVEAEAVEFRWRGTVRWRVPRGVVHGIAAPPGLRDRFFHRFNQPIAVTGAPSGAWSSGQSLAWEHSVQEPLAAGSWSAWRRLTGSPAAGSRATLTLLFLHDQQPVVLILDLLGDGRIEAQVPANWSPTFHQTVRLATGWEKLRVTWDARGCRLSVGDRLLNEWACPGLRSVGCRLEGTPGSDASPIEVDDLAVQEHQRARPEVPVPLILTDDCVTLWSGDQLFGRVTIDRRGTITVTGRSAAWSGTWAEVMRINFAPAKIPDWGLSPVRGCCFDARTPPMQSTGGLSEVWRGCAWRTDGFEHPLGRVWIDPQSTPAPRSWMGLGEWSWLSTGRHFLDSKSADQPLRRVVGGRWESARAGSGWAAIDVQGLSPSGPGTPDSELMLSELRRGGWRTELTWNGTIISDLNHKLYGQNPLTERVWIPLPRLTAGQNAWHLQQQPAHLNDHRYDDGQFGPIGLWRPMTWP